MSWLSPGRWLLLGALAAALVLGYFAWSDRIGDKREAEVLARVEKQRSVENERNAQITADLQKRKDDALEKANTRARANKAAADELAAVNRGLRDDLDNQRRDLSTASESALRQYASTANSVFGECSAEVERLERAATGHLSDSLMLLEAWPR